MLSSCDVRSLSAAPPPTTIKPSIVINPAIMISPPPDPDADGDERADHQRHGDEHHRAFASRAAGVVKRARLRGGSSRILASRHFSWR